MLFMTSATNVLDDQSNLGSQIYLRNLESGINYLASVDSEGTAANSTNGYPVVSGDGTYITFQSFADNLVPGDVNGQYDIFRIELNDLILSIRVTASKVVMGSDADFAVEVLNDAALPAHNVVLALPVPTGAQFFQGALASSACTVSDGKVECIVPTIEPGETATGTLSFVVQSAGEFELQASVQGDLPDASTDDNTDAVTVTVQEPAPAPGTGAASGGGGSTAPLSLLLLCMATIAWYRSPVSSLSRADSSSGEAIQDIPATLAQTLHNSRQRRVDA